MLPNTAQTLMLQTPQGQPPRPIAVFQRALLSLLYTNSHPEPTLVQRRITIAPMDMAPNCISVELTVNVLPLNDNPPKLVLSQGNTLQYTEESGQLAFAAEAGLMVTDPDHNAVFPMESATVVLQGILDGDSSELLQFSGSALPAGVEAAAAQDGECP